ncbi:catalase family peroxidase [Burkholderia plantarii]|uniref:Catalase-related peroxidase n=1 Tax=Burkholderia plantarii TaxID=41899 RepID=A0A0B6RZP4_BURPL|nr:catalase family peroxidase [Burkholderia plantarii]AJK50822.1 putative catalase [Burkholderia plantarii]
MTRPADTHRRSFLCAATRLTVAGAVAPMVGLPAATTAADMAVPDTNAARDAAGNEYGEATARRSLDALESAHGAHPGQRRNHTKGVGVTGRFVGNPAAAAWSRSLLFSGETIEVVGRFSLAGGDPGAADTERSTRGVGLQFRLPGGALQHMTMLHTPMFFATMPKTFIDKFFALTPEPATGKPDPAVFKAFLASHPDHAAQAHFLGTVNPPWSHASCAFYGIHTFRFVDGRGKVTMVRWRFVPRDGERALGDDEMRAAPHDFLEARRMERLARGPAQWDMIVSIGEPGDPVTNPTLPWPKERREIHAGTLTLTHAMAQEHAPSHGINFDPLVMADGIEPSDDPILLFRSPSYGLSYSRRLRRV